MRTASKRDPESLLSHHTGLVKWMETEQSPVKLDNACVFVRLKFGVSVDVWQMFCSISRPKNNGRECFRLSSSVRYINPIKQILISHSICV